MCISAFTGFIVTREDNVSQLIKMICVLHYNFSLSTLTPTMTHHSHEFHDKISKKAKKKNFIISIWAMWIGSVYQE